MKLVLDNLIFSWQKIGGISIFWSKIIDMVLHRLPTDDVSFYEYPNSTTNIVRKHIQLPSQCLFFLPNIYFTLQRYLNLSLSKIREPFIFHSSYYRICTHPQAINILTIHDFTYEKYTSGLQRFVHVFHKYKALRKADFIVCISENTRQDLFHYLPDIDPQKVGIIHNGVSEVYRPLSDEEKAAFPTLPQEFLLFVGNRAPYKQFNFAIQVAQSTHLPLVVVGPPLSEEETEKLRQHQVEFHSKAYALDEELCCYYNQATALLYPSEYEGFGIPVIEAQRCGCPVIAFNASSIPEVIGDYPLLLNQLSVADAQKHIQRLVQEPEFKKQIQEIGFANSKRFSWQKMQDQYFALYQQLWAKHLS